MGGMGVRAAKLISDGQALCCVRFSRPAASTFRLVDAQSFYGYYTPQAMGGARQLPKPSRESRGNSRKSAKNPALNVPVPRP